MDNLATSSAGSIHGNSRTQKKEIFPSIEEKYTHQANGFGSAGGANLGN